MDPTEIMTIHSDGPLVLSSIAHTYASIDGRCYTTGHWDRDYGHWGAFKTKNYESGDVIGFLLRLQDKSVTLFKNHKV